MSEKDEIREEISDAGPGPSRTDTSLCVLENQAVPPRETAGNATDGKREKETGSTDGTGNNDKRNDSGCDDDDEDDGEAIEEEDIRVELNEDLDAAFAYIPFAYLGPSATTYAGSVSFRVTREASGDPPIERFILVRDGRATVVEENAGGGAVDCTVTIERDILLLVLGGDLDPAFALMCGQLAVDDLNALRSFADAFKFDRDAFDGFRARYLAGEITEEELALGKLKEVGETNGGGSPCEKGQSAAADSSSSSSSSSRSRGGNQKSGDAARKMKIRLQLTRRFLKAKRDKIMASDVIKNFNVQMAASKVKSSVQRWGLAGKLRDIMGLKMDAEQREKSARERERLERKLEELKLKNQGYKAEREERKKKAIEKLKPADDGSAQQGGQE